MEFPSAHGTGTLGVRLFTRIRPIRLTAAYRYRPKKSPYRKVMMPKKTGCPLAGHPVVYSMRFRTARKDYLL